MFSYHTELSRLIKNNDILIKNFSMASLPKKKIKQSMKLCCTRTMPNKVHRPLIKITNIKKITRELNQLFFKYFHNLLISCLNEIVFLYSKLSTIIILNPKIKKKTDIFVKSVWYNIELCKI